jgi:hypothetical protein
MHIAIRIRYSDIRENYPRKYLYIRYPTDIRHIVFEFDIRIRIRYQKIYEYPKIPSNPAFTIFKSRFGLIFSEPYYIPREREQADDGGGNGHSGFGNSCACSTC